ncbi:MAG: nicotinate-nucleotide--dimethylbenzimidazole phosphoribosyltransferase [Pseudonocardiales bacterium]|nr:nicotinate-nucleotide--dimethylbenzimidazole phosphoribosyltransferase [Pseudonocardiales bacterium]
MTDAAPSAIDLVALAADVEWTDAAAAASARAETRVADGRLAELVEWLASTQGRYPPERPARPRCIVMGPVSDSTAAIAETFDVGVRSVDVAADASVSAALTAGAAAADDEVDAGADLLIVADPDSSAAPAVLVSLLTGAEPVALLPRGAAATDTAAWISRAEYLRDARRRVAQLRGRPDELLAELDHPPLAATTAFLLRAAGRRTPIILDGSAAAAAALLGYETQSRTGRWWRLADTSSDPVHVRVAEELVQRPLLDLGTSSGDGTAGLLALAVLRAAVHLGVPHE